MYKALVARISIRPHPNADRLQLGTIQGHQVVVDLTTPDGELGVFFPCDGQLSAEMCRVHNLIGGTDPVTGKHTGGYFPKNRRVRAQKFRGEKSDGYYCPLSWLAWTGYDLTLLKEGDAFDELNGQPICQKYYTPATLTAMGRQRRGQSAVPRRIMFPPHVDTAQWRYHNRNVPRDSVIYISEKLHGTSGRYGHVAEVKPLPWFRRIVNKLAGGDGTVIDWKHLHGSRNVILNDDQPGFYGTNEFRRDVVGDLQLHQGEVLYYEIVGDVTTGTPIMPAHPIKDELKDLKKQYGARMEYRYGTVPGERKLFVYRITQINEQGREIELSWPQVVGRCKELGLQTVPVLATALAAPPNNNHTWLFLNGEGTWLSASGINPVVETLTDGESTLDSRHIREGVVVRIESSEGIKFLKNKSFAFGVLEGYIKDIDTYVDLEEAS